MSWGMNQVRGDVELVLNGEVRRLRLTFGALAEIEAVLGARGLAEMGVRVRGVNARELLQVLEALLRGGGEQVAAGEVELAPVNLRAVAEAVAAVFRVALT